MARVIVGRYRLVRHLGRGGMGTVWQARDTLLQRDVAVKEIWLSNAGHEPVDPADPVVRRALREAQAAARLSHPGIVTVHDVVTDEGRPWIVMELIEGRSLAQIIQEHGLLTERRTAEIGLQVLDALRAAHREGIAHRDVKPANIMLDAAERVVLTDFGIAAIDDATALTATGQMVGSPAYLAPERINGKPATAASDLWALGVTLYTAVTGRSPFQREDTQATFAAILTSRPAVPAHAGRLWPVIKGLLVKDPARRLGAEQVRKLLANVAHSAGAPQPGGAAPGRRMPRWWPAPAKRRESTLDGLPRTLAAPPPTLAATTAYQQPATPESSVEGQVAAAPPDDTAPATNAQTTAAQGETVAADPATAQTVAQDTVVGDTVAAETAAMPVIPIATQPLLPDGPAAPVPLAPYPEMERGPRTVRARTIWFAALAVGAVLLAGGILRTAWPGTSDGRTTRDEFAGGSSASARGESVKPSVTSATASAPANPSLDSCMVGTWQGTSTQIVITVSGVHRLFTGSGGQSLWIWPDGKSVEDYTKVRSTFATVNGAKWGWSTRGVQTSHVETRGGRFYASEIKNTRAPIMTRNGKVVSSTPGAASVYDLPYTCSETRLTTYGNENASTDSYKRISHTP